MVLLVPTKSGYNKAGNVLRIEITFNNVSEFKVYREVQQRDGQTVKKLANMKKSIYSLEHVIRIGKAGINRYLDFLSKMEDNSTGLEELRQLTERKTENNRNYNPDFHRDKQRRLHYIPTDIKWSICCNWF